MSGNLYKYIIKPYEQNERKKIKIEFTNFVKTNLNKSKFRTSVHSHPFIFIYETLFVGSWYIFFEKTTEKGVWRRHLSLIDGHRTSLFSARDWFVLLLPGFIIFLLKKIKKNDKSRFTSIHVQKLSSVRKWVFIQIRCWALLSANFFSISNIPWLKI